MSLPKHNPLLKGIYVLLVLVMFAFMTMLIKTYWPESDTTNDQYDNYETEFTVNESLTYENKSAINKTVDLNKDEKSDFILKHNFKIVGLKRKVYLNTNVSGQLNEIWEEFNRAELWNNVTQVENYNEIYVVYDQWNFKQNSVDIVIGYPSFMTVSKNSGLASMDVPKGGFLVRQSVLNMWQESSELTLTYTKDFEIYQLDDNYQIQQQSAYLRIR